MHWLQMIRVRSVGRENFIIKLQKFGLTYKHFFLWFKQKIFITTKKMFGVFNLDYWMSTNIFGLAINWVQDPHTFWN